MGPNRTERNVRRIAELIVEEAVVGRFGLFMHLLDEVDGELHPTAEEEGTFEADCLIVVADAGWDAETAKAVMLRAR